MANTAPQFELQTSGPAYGDDYAAWVEHQRTLLREHRFYELDVGNLVEEVGIWAAALTRAGYLQSASSCFTC